MTTVPADLTRAAACRLTELDPALPALVEARLQSGPNQWPPQRYLEPTLAVALASLLVNIAGLAWKAYWDLRSDAKIADATPAPEVLARRVRLEIELPRGVSEQQRDQIIGVMVDEIRRADPGP